MATHSCQNVIIVGNLNQHVVRRTFTELTVVYGLTNHVNFVTHVCGAALDPVLTDLPAHSVQCCQLEREDFVSTNWDATFTEDVNHNVATLTSLILLTQAKHFPHRLYRADPRYQPWFSYRCRQAADKKYKTWILLKCQLTTFHKAQHRVACKALLIMATRARRWETSLRRKLASNEMHPKQWWFLVKQ
ncbi:hypothetical protein E2C01_057085 [Portunus trituberculatus]|uniref:Uncharacterized protein n=1 Tax=Portunus trituberculatus TaxID=210409 RepID=A0A5B7GZ34_PORTR|nr:hypothetical protein [Portunus trituberculatus]